MLATDGRKAGRLSRDPHRRGYQGFDKRSAAGGVTMLQRFVDPVAIAAQIKHVQAMHRTQRPSSLSHLSSYPRILPREHTRFELRYTARRFDSSKLRHLAHGLYDPGLIARGEND
jgi:hypothetical protein